MKLMNNHFSFGLVFLVSGCTVVPQVATVPVEERSIPVETGVEEPEFAIREKPEEKQEPIVFEARVPAVQQQKTVTPEPVPAVVALLTEAEGHARAGRGEQASASLERALHIDPGNALLWHRLAVIRWQQGQWNQAVALAGKSNALSGGSYKLQSANWEIIARAYEALGQGDMAKKARRKAESFKEQE